MPGNSTISTESNWTGFSSALDDQFDFSLHKSISANKRELGGSLHASWEPFDDAGLRPADIDGLMYTPHVADQIRVEDFHRTRPGHDPRYSLASSPPAWWEPPVSFEESLRRTVEWTVQHPEWLM